MRAEARGRLLALARGGGLLAAYVAVVAWLTWPLATAAGTWLPCLALSCTYDAPLTIWSLAWSVHALGTAPLALANANIYFPAPDALFYGPTAFGALPLFAPAYAATANPVLAANVLLVGGIALTAFGLHHVAATWTRSAAAGVVAAATFLANPWLWRYTSAVPHEAALFYLPWLVALAAAGVAGGGTAAAVAALVALQVMVDPVYLAPVVLVPLGLLAGARLARAATRAAGVRLAAALVAAGAVLTPVYLGYAAVRAANPALAAQSLWRDAGANYLVLPTRVSWAGLTNGGTTDVPLAVLVVIALGALGHVAARDGAPGVGRGWRHATLWAVLGALLAVRTVSVAGGAAVPMPHFRLLGAVAGDAVRLARFPDRLGVGAMVGIALLAGLGTDACARAAARLGRRPALVVPLRAAVAALVILALHGGLRAGVPRYRLWRGPERVAAVRAALAAGQGPVLEVPVREGEAFADLLPTAVRHARAMFASIGIWRPLLNGYSSYYPAGFPGRMALARRLPDLEALRRLRAETGLTSIVVHLHDLDPAERVRWRQVDHDALRIVAADAAHLLFAVGPAAALP
jgi:hypothetical protein